MLESLEVYNLFSTANSHGLDDALKLLRLAKTVVVADDGSVWLWVPFRTRN